MPLEICLTTSNLENLLTGPSTFNACHMRMDLNINGTFSMLLRSGHMVTTLLLKWVNYTLIETLKIILLMLNNLPSAPLIWFQELSPHSTKCFKEDFSLMLIPIDIDWETIMIKFLLIVPIELEFLTDKEMAGQLLMEIKVLNQIINQTLSMSSKLDLKLNYHNSESPV